MNNFISKSTRFGIFFSFENLLINTIYFISRRFLHGLFYTIPIIVKVDKIKTAVRIDTLILWQVCGIIYGEIVI